MLYGPPGTGKTLLARAVAHHTECTFIRVSGSELVQKYIGEGKGLRLTLILYFCFHYFFTYIVGSRMVRELFVMAREHAPSIIFMDEIDSIGSSRIGSGSNCNTIHVFNCTFIKGASHTCTGKFVYLYEQENFAHTQSLMLHVVSKFNPLHFNLLNTAL